ncbi:opsin, ultraviolet-sensitive-like [Eriocheir sinensis]|uniref:opsin, ultraviolet-sensitive-like n=1 Tax=Eriocheir sinensis TaxID=95602 RepID=UPI0021C8E79F|nr:opsin, ultraviolet-sensitive-like [Eriocheir sinensis]
MNVTLNQTPCGLPRCLGMDAPVDLLPLISSHWLAFPPPSTVTHISLGLLFLLITPVACLGNLTIIFLYCRCRRLQNSSNLLVMNLAAADLMMMSKAPIFIANSFAQRPYTGRLGCEIYGFVSLVAGLSAIWFLTAISLDRYRVVRLSITASMSSKSQTRVVVAVVWLTSTVLATIPLFGWNRYVPEGVLSGCTVDYLSERWLDRSFVFLLLLIAWTAPMAAVLFSYIWHTYPVSRGNGFSHTSSPRVSETEMITDATHSYSVFLQLYLLLLFTNVHLHQQVKQSREELHQLSHSHHHIPALPHRKTGTRVATLVGLWAISWTPYALVVLVSVSFSNCVLTPLLSTMPSIFCKASACLNPYVYGLSLPAFKKELRRILARNEPYQGTAGTVKEKGPSLHTYHYNHRTEYGPKCLPASSSYILPSLAPAALQRFMLPNGDIVLGTSYKEAKQKLARKKNTSHVNTSVAPSRHPQGTTPV